MNSPGPKDTLALNITNTGDYHQGRSDNHARAGDTHDEQGEEEATTRLQNKTGNTSMSSFLPARVCVTSITLIRFSLIGR